MGHIIFIAAEIALTAAVAALAASQFISFMKEVFSKEEE